MFKSSISRRLKSLPDWHLGIVSGAHNTINRSSGYMSNPNGAELIENSLENIGGNLWPAHRPADATEPVPLLGNRYYHFFIREIEWKTFVWPKNLWRLRGYKKCQKKFWKAPAPKKIIMLYSCVIISNQYRCWCWWSASSTDSIRSLMIVTMMMMLEMIVVEAMVVKWWSSVPVMISNVGDNADAMLWLWSWWWWWWG